MSSQYSIKDCRMNKRRRGQYQDETSTQQKIKQYNRERIEGQTNNERVREDEHSKDRVRTEVGDRSKTVVPSRT